jgi:tRNA pseudouridine13 synthase
LFDEDFRVEEIAVLEGLRDEPRPGYFPLYRVEKQSIDTLHLERELRTALRSRVSYAGLKDKKAVTVQYVSPTRSRSERPKSIVREKFSARLVGYLPRPVSTSSIRGNRFRILLRDCCPGMRKNVEEVFELGMRRKLPNFFGQQRFGGEGGRTHKVGKAILKREFHEAVRIMLTEPRPLDDEETKAAREAMAKGDFRTGARLLPPQQDTEVMVARRLSNDPERCVDALRSAPVRLRRLFVQAFQSYVFNRAISAALERGVGISEYESGDNWIDERAEWEVRGVRELPPGEARPMVQLAGFAYRDYGSRFDSLTSEVMEEEGVSPRDFYVQEMQEASAEGGFRIPHLVTSDTSFEIRRGETLLKFGLARGQYATVLLREITKT